jgi:hypothetical protein
MEVNHSRKNRKELPAVCVVKNIKVDTEALVAYCYEEKLFDTRNYEDINVIQYPLVKGKSIPSSHFTTHKGMQDFTTVNSFCKESFFKEEEAEFLQGEKYKQLYLTEFDSTKRSGNISYNETTIFQRSKRLDPKHSSYLPEADEYNYGIKNELVRGEIEKVLKSFKAPLARVRFASLAPNFKLKPHVDYDPSYITRYHIPLQTNKDCLMCVIDRNGNKITKQFNNDGKVYFLNTGLKHWAENNSSEERIHLIVDTKNQQDLQY